MRRKNLITRAEIGNVFSDIEVAELVKAANLSVALDISILASGIRSSLEGYLTGTERWRAMTAPKPIGNRVEKEGRKRPGGKRSGPALEQVLANPPPKRGRPPNDFEVDFIRMLRITWEDAAGRPPADTASSNEFYQGPFVRLCDEVLKRAGVQVANSAALINKIAASKKNLKDF